jgi:hypothetical protein
MRTDKETKRSTSKHGMPDGRRSMHDIHIELDVRQVLAITVGHQVIMDCTSCMSMVLPCHPRCRYNDEKTISYFSFFFACLIRGHIGSLEVTCSAVILLIRASLAAFLYHLSSRKQQLPHTIHHPCKPIILIEIRQFHCYSSSP